MSDKELMKELAKQLIKTNEKLVEVLETNKELADKIAVEIIKNDHPPISKRTK